MSVQDLYYLPCLQVPKVHLHVFAAAHDMLPSWSEVREYAECPICVSRVRLHTFRGLRVP